MEEFKIRDKRNRGWFYLDNEYIDNYAKYVGAIGLAVYVILCRHADARQRCFPSQELIAYKIGVSSRTVRSYLRLLERFNMIVIKRDRYRRTNKWRNNIYYLIDKTKWIKP